MRRGADFFCMRGVIATMCAIGGFLFASTALAGTGDNVEGWAWSGTVGWVSMNCTNTNGCSTAEYGVRLDDIPGQPADANLSGYAWADAVGWICFGTTCSGTTPEGGAAYAQYRELDSGRQDQLYGWAKVVNMGGDGWISLNCVDMNGCATSSFATVLNPTTGLFTKGGVDDHWAWGANSDGTGLGWVDMSSVSTTWVAGKLGKIGRPQGVFEPQAAGLAGTHLFTFLIGFSQFTGAAHERLECVLALPDATTKTIGKTLAATTRGGNESLTYTLATNDTVAQNKLWFINSCLIAGTTTAAACTSDAQCAFCDASAGNKCRALGSLTGISCTADADCAAAATCDEGAAKCRPTAAFSGQKRPVFTHANTWTGLGNGEDQYNAIKCNAGFPGTYFNNPSVCDFTGDASFSLAERRGIPIEGNCDDGIDNDGNGQIDCGDRYCQGIAYLCKTPPPTACVYGREGDKVLDCTDLAYQRGELCCTKQPTSEANPNLEHIVNGLECTPGSANDGYYDCSCDNSGAWSASGTDDCFAPGATVGDLCCDAGGNVATK